MGIYRLRTLFLSTCVLLAIASCEAPEEAGPKFQVVPEEKGASAVNADAGWEQVANLGKAGPNNQWKFIGISEREGYLMAAIQTSQTLQQGENFGSRIGYIDADGFFRGIVSTPGSYTFSYQKPEPGASYGFGNQNYFLQGRAFSILTYSNSTAGNVFYRVTQNGILSISQDIGYGTIFNGAFTAMPYYGPTTIVSPGNTGYYAYTWLVGAPVQRIVEYNTAGTTYDIPVIAAQNQNMIPVMVPEDDKKMHLVYVGTKRGTPTELVHYTKNLRAEPVLVGRVSTTLPDSATFGLLYQAGKLVVTARVANRAMFVDAVTGATIADVSVQRNENNSPLVSAALMPDGTPVIAFSDATAGNKLTVLRCAGSVGTPLGKVGLTNGTTGANLYTLKGALYAGIVNQEARSLAIIKLKQ